MKTIKEVLIKRDGLTENEAQKLIDEAMDQLYEHFACGEMDCAEAICAEYFGLEPDYLMELMELM